MLYSLPYIVLILVYGVMAIGYHYHYHNIARQRYVLLSIVIFLFFFGLRGFCFYDWNSYYVLFHKYTLHDLSALPVSKWPTEPVFALLMCICHAIVPQYNFFVFVCSAINIILLYIFFRRRIENMPLAIMVSICMGGITIFTDLMRNAISILLFINSLNFIEKRRAVPYFCINLIAIGFHSTAVFYLPLYFLIHRNFGKWIFLFFFIAGNLIYLLQIHVLFNIVTLFASLLSPETAYKIKAYSEMLHGAGVEISIGYIERLLTGILVFIYYRRLIEVRAENVVFINALMLYFAMFFFLSEFKVLSLRFSFLFIFSYWILWIDMIKCFSVANNRKLFILFLAGYCLLKIYGSTNNVIANYDNVLFGADSFQKRQSIFNKNFNSI